MRSAPASPSLSFEVGDLFDLRFDDGTFDVVHAHQVLQHVGDPVAALGRDAPGVPAGRHGRRPGQGLPRLPLLPRRPGARPGHRRLRRADPAQRGQLGRRPPAAAAGPIEAGFTSVVPSASTWCFATPEDRAWWGGLWADRFTQSALAEQLVDHGIATPEDLTSFAAAWRRWAASPGRLVRRRSTARSSARSERPSTPAVSRLAGRHRARRLEEAVGGLDHRVVPDPVQHREPGVRPGRSGGGRSWPARRWGRPLPHTTASGDGWRSMAPVNRASLRRRSSM